MTKLRDLIIVLPGVMGSVLQKDGRDLWGASRQAIAGFLFARSRALNDLKLQNDDPTIDDIGDGITPHRVVDDIVLLPDFVNILDGYTGIRKMIQSKFDGVIAGTIHESTAANYIEFPYDWRRSNLYNSRKLEELIDERLPLWREHSGAEDAKVIIIAHSMGGIISRHCLEVRNNWSKCKALFTLGSPHRGSLNTLKIVANGKKILGIDLTEAARSFPPLYEMLPIYPAVFAGAEAQRIDEIDNFPNITREKAEKSLEFLRSINDAAAQNQTDNDYLRNGYKMIPIVGTYQQTHQTAEIDANGIVTVSRKPPTGMEAGLVHGDGTVPFVSAIPAVAAGDFRDIYVAEKHGALQNNNTVLDYLYQMIERMQIDISQWQNIGLDQSGGLGKPAMGLDMPNFVGPNESFKIQANIHNFDATQPLTVRARLTNSEDNQRTSQELTKNSDNVWETSFDELPDGLYRVELTANHADINSVHDAVAIVRSTEDVEGN